MNSPDNTRQLANAWISAFNNHNIENLLDLYADDAEHYSPKLKIKHPETNGWVKGKLSLRTWWEDAFTRIPTLHYELKNLLVDENQVLMEYLRKADGEADMMVAELLLIGNGRIIRSKVYHG